MGSGLFRRSIIALGIAFVVVFVILYVIMTYLSAKVEVSSAPRTAFYECPKHGFMRAEHLIEHVGQKICPVCFAEKVRVPLDGSVRVN